MNICVLCILVIISVAQAEYPTNLPKCKNGDADCLIKAANEFTQKHSSGIRELGLTTVDPLHIKKMVLERNPTSPVNIDITFSDTDVFNMKTLKFSSLKGFNADLSGRTSMEAKAPELRFVGKYKVDGRILILPVVGDGDYEVKMKNVVLKFSFDTKSVEKNGKKYASLEHVKLDIEPEHVHFKFDNLFNGDKLLGDNMNVFLNENWKEIYQEVNPSLAKAYGLVMKAVMNGVFDKTPYAEFFI